MWPYSAAKATLQVRTYHYYNHALCCIKQMAILLVALQLPPIFKFKSSYKRNMLLASPMRSVAYTMVVILSVSQAGLNYIYNNINPVSL